MDKVPPFDLDKMTWKCHCCKQERADKYMKTYSHDISVLFGTETGTIFINCRHCADLQICGEKARNREWVIKHYLGDFIRKELNNVE